MELSRAALIKQANATSNRLVNVRQSSNTSLLPENFTKSSKKNTLHEKPGNQSDENSNNKRHQTLWCGVAGFDTVLKLVSGTLLGGERFADVYAEIDVTGQDEDDYFRHVSIDPKILGPHSNVVAKVPTLGGVAWMVARV